MFRFFVHGFVGICFLSGLFLSLPVIAQSRGEVSELTVDLVESEYGYEDEDQDALQGIEDALKSFGEDDDRKFLWLRKKRSEIQAIVPRQQAAMRKISSHLNALETGLARRKSEKQLIEGRVRSAERDEPEEIDKTLKRITEDKKSLERKLATVNRQLSPIAVEQQQSSIPQLGFPDEKRDRLIFRKEEFIDEIDYLKRRMEDLDDRKKSLDRRISDWKKDLDTIDKDIGELSRLISSMKKKSDALVELSYKTTRYVKELDDAIGFLLIPETAQNKFKLNITVAFSGLVLIVIVGFFVVSWRDEEVRRSIFSSQSGIQFLTLFSLVIAIILFGILDILEGKELAALLGGLSGYILGRVSGSDRPTKPASPSKPIEPLDLSTEAKNSKDAPVLDPKVDE